MGQQEDSPEHVSTLLILLESVKVVSITPIMHDTRNCPGTGHMESIQLRYEKITWRYVDGNIQYSDAWNERATV